MERDAGRDRRRSFDHRLERRTVDFLDDLAWRGLLHQTTSPQLAEHLASGARRGYCGFDPTAASLTVGNLLPLLLLRRFQIAGHQPIALLGGATGLIGDPSGKSAERNLLDEERVRANLAAQRPVFERVLEFGGSAGAILLDNSEWLARLGYLEVLREVGKHFSVNAMVQRDSVATRLATREQGISYTEFSYMVLQAYDFLHLHRHHGCTVQMGGSDQFGNIVSGIDLIRRLGRGAAEESGDGPAAFGVTTPLVTTADGRKIGKTESGSVWLNAGLTSPYRFHQYWLNASDADAGRFLRWFTLLAREEIESLEAEVAARPQERAAARRLAAEVTDLIHGPTERRRAEAAAEALFAGRVRELDAAILGEIVAELPSSNHPAAQLAGEGADLATVLAESGAVRSKREAREFLAQGAISVNGERVDASRRLVGEDRLAGGVILLRRGRREWHATLWG